jgi:hypothetical protein
VVFDFEKGKETVQLDTLRKVLLALNITMRFEIPLMREYDRQVTADPSEGPGTPGLRTEVI